MFQNRKVIVVGLARSGLSAARALVKAGAYVTLNDSKTEVEGIEGIRAELDLGGQPSSLTYDYMVLSPGVPTDLSFILKAKEAGVKILGALEVGFLLTKGHYYGITGTNGKTTTTTLTHEIFKQANLDAYAVGNIGKALASVEDSTDKTHFITEVSSFQLESTQDFHVHIAAILNLAPDHLNRHKTMEAYVACKAKLVNNQTENDYVVLNYDDELTRKLSLESPGKKLFFSKEPLDYGFYVEAGSIYAHLEKKVKLLEVKDIQLPGLHNLENILAACAIAYLAGIKAEDIRLGVINFTGVEHRIELVGHYHGLTCYNDSKGTNPESSIVALKSMTRPTLLIAGGMDKGSDFEVFVDTFKDKVKHAFLLGETKEIIADLAKSKDFYQFTFVETMEEAVEQAFELASDGDALLLSPACASWDMYPSYEVRGEHFKECLKKTKP